MRALKTPASNGLRAWQVGALEAMSTWQSGTFLISAAPGAGKTRPAIEVARDLLARRVVRPPVKSAAPYSTAEPIARR